MSLNREYSDPQAPSPASLSRMEMIDRFRACDPENTNRAQTIYLQATDLIRPGTPFLRSLLLARLMVPFRDSPIEVRLKEQQLLCTTFHNMVRLGAFASISEDVFLIGQEWSAAIVLDDPHSFE